MDEQTRHEVQQWIFEAEHDPLLDTAVYHCQQVAEKALKSFLLGDVGAYELTPIVMLEFCCRAFTHTAPAAENPLLLELRCTLHHPYRQHEQ